jgi:hypothetical protein
VDDKGHQFYQNLLNITKQNTIRQQNYQVEHYITFWSATTSNQLLATAGVGVVGRGKVVSELDRDIKRNHDVMRVLYLLYHLPATHFLLPD